jgi:hypothetical protein
MIFKDIIIVILILATRDCQAVGKQTVHHHRHHVPPPLLPSRASCQARRRTKHLENASFRGYDRFSILLAAVIGGLPESIVCTRPYPSVSSPPFSSTHLEQWHLVWE